MHSAIAPTVVAHLLQESQFSFAAPKSCNLSIALRQCGGGSGRSNCCPPLLCCYGSGDSSSLCCLRLCRLCL